MFKNVRSSADRMLNLFISSDLAFYLYIVCIFMPIIYYMYMYTVLLKSLLNLIVMLKVMLVYVWTNCPHVYL